MHANWTMRLKGIEGPYSPAHLKVDFEEFDYGFRYLRLREDTDENNPLWTIGRCCLWPNCLFTGDHFEWRVPIDDENTLSVGWFFNRVPQGKEPYIQDSIPSWTSPLTDPETGRWIDTHVMNQDFIAWVGQGTFADRTKETLGKSDKGIAMLRKQFFDDMELIDNNKTDPKGIVRDPDINECIQLPIMNRKRFLEGLTPEEMADPNDIHGRSTKRFVFLAGQPQEVWETYCEAMRFKK
jgi:5,5'-dehydrodivanillate O-demethylase